jgi:hypothetical protein
LLFAWAKVVPVQLSAAFMFSAPRPQNPEYIAAAGEPLPRVKLVPWTPVAIVVGTTKSALPSEAACPPAAVKSHATRRRDSPGPTGVADRSFDGRPVPEALLAMTTKYTGTPLLRPLNV